MAKTQKPDQFSLPKVLCGNEDNKPESTLFPNRRYFAIFGRLIKLVRIFSAFLFFCATTLSTIASENPAAIGIKIQAYPAGIVPVANGAFSFGKASMLNLYAGYNFTDRRDFGKHENEEGGGPGFGLAWRYYFGKQHNGWHIGVRTDLWFLDIDWEDDGRSRTGSTEITVLQPTAQAGYTWVFNDNRLALSATAALGAEINIKTDGEDVGEGAILLLGVGFKYRF